jgi:hypothetical protein
MSVCRVSARKSRKQPQKSTNVEQNCAIFLLLDNMVLEDLVVQCLRGFHCRRHGGYVRFMGIWEAIGGIMLQEQNEAAVKVWEVREREVSGLLKAHVVTLK